MRVAGRRPEYERALRVRSARRRAARKRAALGLLLVALIFALVWLPRACTSHPGAAVVVKVTPAPPPFKSEIVKAGSPWSARQVHDLARDASSVFGEGLFPASTGVVVETARSGEILYSRHANAGLVPASVLKLIVAATALRDLGPAYRFTTRLVTEQPPQGDTIPGSLWLVGSGDPELISQNLQAAVAGMKAAGTLRIDRDVVADGSLFGPDEVNPTWEPDDLEYGYAALTSAVTMDGGTAQFTITPNPNGADAVVRVDPAAIGGELLGSVGSGPEGAENTLRIDPLPDGSGFQLSGVIPYGAPQKYWRSLAHPTQSAAVALRTMLVDAGISVGGGAIVGTAPIGATTIWSKRSRPLTPIIRRMMFDSDNHIAEQLLRAVGAKQSGMGSLANGLAAERDYLRHVGVGQSGLVLADASGLSTADRLTARATAGVLRELVSGPEAASVIAVLPRVGIDGTVHVRQLAPDVLGRVLGKDGYIEGVTSLAGYVKTAHHGLVIYVFLVNGWENGLDAIWASEDGFLSRLARY
jgi:D-alanyl-D-alanine carboxypeptidase/D-alanyl-D-alanine-endopeptidase (penicillin-binding protein 4)